MSMKKLDSDVVSKIRSSFTVNSVAQCVFELVTNSLDAKSTSIAIRINLLTYKIQVADNGEGITKENMRFVGTRHTTNKCQNYKDLEQLKTYGYRGEAIASIVELCKTVTISSRCKSSKETYLKHLSKQFISDVKLARDRASVGTTVTVLGWLNNMPVRQQRIVEEIELENVKKQLEALIIINPTTSFSLRNDVTGLLIINIPKSPNIVDSFRRLHPEINESFTLFKVTKGKVTVKMLIQKELLRTKQYQYVYVNKRPVKSLKIMKHIYKALCKKNKSQNSLLYNNKKYPVYVMNIKCPQNCVDTGSSKVELELTCWDLVLACIDKLIKIFFNFEDNNNKDLVKIHNKKEAKINCGLSRMFGVVEATAYKRKSHETVSDSESTKKIRLIEQNLFVQDKTKPTTQTTGNYQIEDSAPIKYKPNEIKSIMKKPPLKIKIKPGTILKNEEQQFDQRSIYSKLNTDENLGKNLILDMFLKSTQVYSSQENFSNDETIQESNILFENNIQDTVRGINTTMSVSVNVKKKKINNQKPEIKSILKNTTSKSIQTSQNLLFPRQKSLQTELADKFEGFSLQDNNEKDFKDNYTILISTVNKKKEYLFVKKSEEMMNVDNEEEEIKFKPIKICHCEDDENFFKFKQNEFKKPLSNQEIISKRKRTSIPKYKPSLPSQSPYFSTNNKISTDFKTKSPFFNAKPLQNPINPRIVQMPQNNYCCQCHHFQPKAYQNFHITIPNRPRNEPIYNHNRERVVYIENDSISRWNWNQRNCNQIPENIEAKLPTLNEALDEPQWYTPNVTANENFYVERSPQIDNNNKIFDFKLPCSPNIFSSNEDRKDLNNFCDSKDNDVSKGANSCLEISIPSKKEQLNLIEKNLVDEQNFNKNLKFASSKTQKSEDEKTRYIVDSQNVWLRQKNNTGKNFFFNQRTGMVTAKTPKLSQTKFDFDERLDFVPKGLSPALKGHEKVDTILSQNAKNTLQKLILEGYEDELMFVKWQDFVGDSPKTFFQKLYQEKAKKFETNIPSVHDSALEIPKNFVNFDKNMFKNLEFIGQLDKKFIVAYEKIKDLLILFDQHAVHERIRVERFSKEYKGIKTPHKEKLTIFLPHNDLSLLKNNAEYLESLGLGVEFFTNGLHITDIPLCIQEKINNGFNSEDLIKILNILIKDIVEYLKLTRGRGYVNATTMPKILQNLINLKACRGAVKFGNILSKNQCLNLLEDLSKCTLPFQCAHGRPTLSPVLSLGKIDLNNKEKRPNLKKLMPINVNRR